MKYGREFTIVNATVIEKHPIDGFVKESACYCERLAVANVQSVVIAAERLSSHFIEERKRQVEILLTPVEILKAWVVFEDFIN